MQINDLPQGTPTASDVVPFNTNGLDYKATMEDITELVEVSDKPVTFTSDDEETPTAYKTMATLASGALNTLMGILSKAVSNVRFLYSKLTELTTQVNNNTDSINTLNSNLAAFLVRERFNITLNFNNANYAAPNFNIAKSGYTPIGIIGFKGGANTITYRVTAVNLINTTASITVVNSSGQAETSSQSGLVDVLYIKDLS